MTSVTTISTDLSDKSGGKDLDDEHYFSYVAAQTSSSDEPAVTSSPVTPQVLQTDNTCGKKNCNNVGICKNEVCYCDLYHSGKSCEKDIAHPGVKTWVSFIFFIIAVVLGVFTGYFIIQIQKKHNKKN